MQPRISVLTIGVKDLQKSVAFYRDGLGLPTKGIIGEEHEHGAVAFFDLQNGLKLALWPYESIAHDTGIATQTPNPGEFTLGHNVNSKKEVDDVFTHAINAGATQLKPPQDTFWGGYSGYFQDLDGHIWEIVWNPDIKV
jgi:catechol 2,3-dioxygenase-like lactoylglutathione lyase family enzyme